MGRRANERPDAGTVVYRWLEKCRKLRLWPAYSVALVESNDGPEYQVLGPNGPVDDRAAVIVLGEVLNGLREQIQAGEGSRCG